ncbi:MAG TPA: MmgE/PrpD family protein [Polymorphobacter sp.]|nr:MmgE/PrpD family protein [Polymorphobacter sp.]
MTPTQSILAFAAAAHTLPPEIATAATALLGDTLAVGAAGSGAPGADGVLAAARGWGAGDDAPLLGRAGRLPAPAAAFVNGFQIHSLEWDAVHEVAVVHAMSVVSAALHAVCARAAARGAPVEAGQALVALAVGVDVACGLGIAATEGMRFFRPATAGLIGAALACARVAGTPPAAFADVLGLAFAQAGGTMQAHVEGSLALPLQIAAAARAAVTAVDLANAGLTGPHDALEGPFGYFKLFDAGVIERYSASIGSGWRIGEVSIKPWPSGRAAHATLGVLAAMIRDAGVTAAQVSEVQAHVPPFANRMIGRPWVAEMTPAYARLCLPLLVALMLGEGRIDPRRFEPATFTDANLRAIGNRVKVIEVAGDANALSPQRIVVLLNDGRVLDRQVPATPGHPANPLSPAEQAAKLRFALSLAAGPVDPRIRDNPLAWLVDA